MPTAEDMSRRLVRKYATPVPGLVSREYAGSHLSETSLAFYVSACDGLQSNGSDILKSKNSVSYF